MPLPSIVLFARFQKRSPERLSGTSGSRRRPARSQVRVERIKNRMSEAYNSSESAGYRDVCVNLRVINPTAVALGVELHMCEVQLILKGFAQLKTRKCATALASRALRELLGSCGCWWLPRAVADWGRDRTAGDGHKRYVALRNMKAM